MSYLNAKPSKISNLGEDTKGARRHNFLTYEQEQEKKAQNKAKKEITATLKILKQGIIDTEDLDAVLKYEEKSLELNHGFTSFDRASLRSHISTIEDRVTSNKAVRAANKYLNIACRVKYARNCDKYKSYVLKKYQPKVKSEIRTQNGLKSQWKTELPLNEENLQWLAENTKAVQFGNSVTDKERTYIINNLKSELALFTSLFNLDIKKISFSFGSRGKAGSVAYYSPSLNAISVNRYRVGSLVHELAHALDYENNLISDRISIKTRNEYFEAKIKNKVPYKFYKYYRNKKEIFARAIEAYCLDKGFSEFSLSGNKSFLPELNEDLENTIKLGLK